MDISKRLKAVAHAVTPGKILADIGTDHGYVPIYLVKKGSCPKAIAMDVNQGPLERAKEHILKEGLEERIQTRRSNGMDKLEAGEAESIVIAGMGGDLTSRILQAGKDILSQGVELILQPQSEWFKVRHTLHHMGYRITEEWFLKDAGKYYLIIKAMPGQESYASESAYAYGACLHSECKAVYEEYLNREIKKREEIASAMRKHQKNPESLQVRLKEIDGEVKEMKERLTRLMHEKKQVDSVALLKK